MMRVVGILAVYFARRAPAGGPETERTLEPHSRNVAEDRGERSEHAPATSAAWEDVFSERKACGGVGTVGRSGGAGFSNVAARGRNPKNNRSLWSRLCRFSALPGRDRRESMASGFHVALAAVPFGLEGRAAGIVTARAGGFGRFRCLVHTSFVVYRRRRLREEFIVTDGAIVVGPFHMRGMIKSHVAHF